MESAEKTSKEKLEELVSATMALRKRPLLVLFYPDALPISEIHITGLNLRMKFGNHTLWNPLQELDVLLQTTGGDPMAAYRIAQTIRNVSERVDFLIPNYAYSGGTLMCLSGDSLLLGDSAVISPFDIKRVSGPSGQSPEDTFPEETPDEEVELVAIDHFIQVAKHARIEIERGFRERGWRLSKTDVESQMLCEMVRQLGVLTVAQYYREKNIAQAYASELLKSYMFADGVEQHVLDRILRRLITEAPSHSFPMDYHICKDIGLKVQEMTEQLSDATQKVTELLKLSIADNDLFPIMGGRRFPLIQFFPYNPPVESDDSESDETEQNEPVEEVEMPESMKPATREEATADGSVASGPR